MRRLILAALAVTSLAACGTSASASRPGDLVTTCTTTSSAAGTHSECQNNVKPGTPQPSWLVAR